MAITATEKKQLKKEIVAELKAEASDVLQLEEVTSLAGVRSFPAVRGENPVSVPLSLLDFSPAIDKKVDKVAGKGLSTEDFTTAEKQKLAGIAAGANNYTHPTSHPASMIAQDTTHRFVTDTEKTTWTGKASTAVATQAANGLLSAADKKKLDGIAAGANNYTHPASHPASMITTDESHLFVTAAEKSAWNAKAAATAATQSAMGLMSAADKKKLDGITAGANNYTHPASHPASMIAQDTTHRFVTDTEKTAWNAKAAATAATQLAMGLMSAADKKKLDGIAAGANNYTHPASHPASMIAQDGTHRFVTDAEKAEWNGKTGVLSALHSVSYAELVALRNGKQLRPGHHYRITNFVTTVANDAEARSAGHPFDIIVLATAADTLSEEARAIVNENYAEYFATANLAAWKVWYCLDNDTTRFQWADEANGRGVIYRLVDEWQNDCPYDFKNVQFKRCLTGGSFVDDVVDDWDWKNTHYILSEDMGHFSNMAIKSTNDYRWFFTFSQADNADLDNLRDASLTRLALETEVGAYFNKACNCNTMRPYYTSALVDDAAYVVQALNNIILSSFDGGDGGAIKIYGNTFDIDCYNTTLHDHCYCNTFGIGCCDVVGFKLCQNRFGGGCNKNVFGNSCSNNTFGNYCWNNTFGNSCDGNTFGNDCDGNTFGNDCDGNTFGNECDGNTFGNGCYSNTFGNYCWNNTFGNYLCYLIADDNVKYVAVVTAISSPGYVQRARILNGTSGSNSSNRLQIAFKTNAKGCQFAGLNSSGILKIWTPADLV